MAGSIEGQVLNQRDGQPIEGASLEVKGEGSDHESSSAANGDFRFADLAAGSYELTAKHEGFEDGIYGPLAVLDDIATKLAIALQPKPL